MKILLKTLAVLMSVTIPLCTFCIGSNIILRMPDVYTYEFKSSESLDDLNLGLNDDEAGEFISDFMFGKLDTIQRTASEESKTPLFTEEEVKAANKIRLCLNIVAGLGTVFFAISVAAIVLMKKNGLDYEIRERAVRGVWVYIGVLILYALFLTASMKMNLSLGDYMGYKTEEDNLLPQIITISMQIKLAVAIGVVSSVVFGLAEHGIMRLTAPKKFFSRAE